MLHYALHIAFNSPVLIYKAQLLSLCVYVSRSCAHSVRGQRDEENRQETTYCVATKNTSHEWTSGCFRPGVCEWNNL